MNNIVIAWICGVLLQYIACELKQGANDVWIVVNSLSQHTDRYEIKWNISRL
uniref:Uncharacterized protein n=1 Tax=Anguilla anguilla TaxID=7936 RepID=A0A0E9VDH9_ANGAN